MSAGRLGLTVYSPDGHRSQLVGDLDHAIHTATGFQPVLRHEIHHDINSVMRFYAEKDADPPPYRDPDEARQHYASIPPHELQYGHLVVRMLISGPSLLTLWRGNDAIPHLLNVRGATQPAEASPDSIRGRFWCDNGVCNLIHASDDPDELRRELVAVKVPIDWHSPADSLPLIDPTPKPSATVAHCGLYAALTIANRILMERGEATISVHLPDHGRARETHDMLIQRLQTVLDRWPDSRAGLLAAACLDGDIFALDRIAEQLPASEWEILAVQCAIICHDSWQTDRTPDT